MNHLGFNWLLLNNIQNKYRLRKTRNKMNLLWLIQKTQMNPSNNMNNLLLLSFPPWNKSNSWEPVTTIRLKFNTLMALLRKSLEESFTKISAMVKRLDAISMMSILNGLRNGLIYLQLKTMHLNIFLRCGSKLIPRLKGRVSSNNLKMEYWFLSKYKHSALMFLS